MAYKFFRYAGWLLAAAGSVLPLAAQADVWGFVDSDGMTHFADRKVDERYQLYFKTDNVSRFNPRQVATLSRGFNSVGSGRALAYNPAADAAAGTKANRLVALIHQSRSYKAVSRHMEREASRNGLDHELVQAIIAAESGFNSMAVSNAGAVGLMQIMPATARDMGLQSDANLSVEQKLTDPALNIRLGTRYMKYLVNKFPGRLDLAVAAYNAGHGAVQRAGNAVPRFAETQNYVRTVLSIYQTLKPGAAVAYAGAAPIPLARMPRQGRVNKSFAAGNATGARVAATQATPVVLKMSNSHAAHAAEDAADPAGPATALDVVAAKVNRAETLPAPVAVTALSDDVVLRDPSDKPVAR